MITERYSLEEQYLMILGDLLNDAPRKSNRTGIDTFELPGVSIKADLTEGFPLLTTKKIKLKNVVTELLWFIRGDTTLKYLHEHGNHIWDEWADDEGDLGPIYGIQWRSFAARTYGRLRHFIRSAIVQDGGWSKAKKLLLEETPETLGVDQLAQAITTLKTKPDDRRIIVSAWNPLEIEYMGLPPCHLLYQFLVSGNRLHTIVYQRSADWFLGVPYNIASYALLTHVVSQEVGIPVGSLTMTFGSAHLYENHVEQARTQLKRDPRSLPTLALVAGRPWDGYTPDDITLLNYDPHPFIKAEVAV